MLTTLKNIALVGFTLPSMLRRGLAREVKYQQEVLQVMTVLPGKYRYEQVEAAINASGLYPRDMYELVAANASTPAMKLFYETLNGPDGSR